MVLLSTLLSSSAMVPLMQILFTFVSAGSNLYFLLIVATTVCRAAVISVLLIILRVPSIG